MHTVKDKTDSLMKHVNKTNELLNLIISNYEGRDLLDTLDEIKHIVNFKMTASIMSIEKLAGESAKQEGKENGSKDLDTKEITKLEQIQQSLKDQYKNIQALLGNDSVTVAEPNKSSSPDLLLSFFDYITLDYNFNTISETILNQKLNSQFKREMVDSFLELQEESINRIFGGSKDMKDAKEGSLEENLNHVGVDDILNVPSLPFSMMSDDDPNFKPEVFQHL